LKGLEEIRSRATDFFQTAYPLGPQDHEAWGMLTVTPLDWPAGGAVVVQSEVTPHTLTTLAPQTGDMRVRGIVDAVPRVDTSARHRADAAVDDIAARLLAAQEAERSRIARDLHDDLGQQVVLLETTIEAALSGRGTGQPESVLMATRTKLRELAASIHTLAYSLHPAKLKLLGLVQTLEAHCREVAAEARQEVKFHAHDVPPEIDEDVVLCIFRVAQEALQNALKHSGAGTIDVQLSGSGERLTLRVVDDGTGFDPDGPRPGGLGLLTMRERVEMVGGTLTVSTARARGTTIEASVNAKRHVESV
jgi:signal transduction histidine kinase